jgi:protein gp37
MHPDWVCSVQQQCEKSGVPFFFKQWGDWQDGSCVKNKREIGKHIYMLNDGQTFDNNTEKGLVNIKNVTSEYWNKHNAKVMAKVGRKASGNLLDGKKYEEYPSFDSAQDDRESIAQDDSEINL